jgi:ankyrin repeat protein
MVTDANQKEGGSMDEASEALMSAASRNDVSAVQELLKKGGSANIVDPDGWTPLMWASDNRNADMARLLLAAGADPNWPARDGWTALLKAVDAGGPELVEMLLNKGADPHGQNYGWPTLMWAVDRGNAAIVEKLLEAGADPHARLRSGESVQEAAAERAPRAITDLLARKVREVVPVSGGPGTEQERGGSNQEESATSEASRGRKRSAFSTDTERLLAAVNLGNVEVARRWLDAGADPNGRESIQGWPALLMTVARRHVGLMSMLLDAGADPDVRGPDGQTPLMKAAAGSFADAEIVRVLLAAGADPRLKDNNGDRAFDLADRERRQTIAVMLARAEVDLETGRRQRGR